MSTRLFGSEAGISNLIATLILIAVAVVGGAFAYTAFRDQAGSTTTSADLQVQSLDAVNASGSTHTFVSITVKNTGTQRLIDDDDSPGSPNTEAIDVVIGGGTELNIGALDPGQTGSVEDHTNYDLDSGKEYAVKISAHTPDGGSITKTTTVRVES